jgi:hypothetical protein
VEGSSEYNIDIFPPCLGYSFDMKVGVSPVSRLN